MARMNPLGKAQDALRDYYTRLQRERAGLVTDMQEVESKIDAVGKALEALAGGSNGGDGPATRAVRARAAEVAAQRAKGTKKARQKNVGQKVASMLEARGRATAADITKTLGINSGSVQYALRTLEEKGKIRQTGRMLGRTREYEIVGTGQIAEPGSADA